MKTIGIYGVTIALNNITCINTRGMGISTAVNEQQL
jgi:hypothetical protein